MTVPSSGKKPVIGLVGGIGSGKSWVAEILREHGAAVISADELGHEALKQPGIKAKIVARWGNDILDAAGEIDRQALGRIVFANEQERRALEELVFPFIQEGIACAAARAQADASVPWIVLDAAIMLETGWNNFCDRIVFVDAPRDVRFERVRRKRGWTAEEFAARERAQWPVEKKARHADFTLDNSQDPAAARRQVIQWLMGLAPSGPPE